MARLTKQAQVKEIIKCGKDPNYFFKNYLKIQHPVRGLIPFEMYPFQEDCVDGFPYVSLTKLPNTFTSSKLNAILFLLARLLIKFTPYRYITIHN